MWASKQIHKRDHRSFIRDARDYALLHGLVLRNDQLNNENCVAHIPFTLFPSPCPKKLYQECLDLQPTVNKLMMKIANDPEFIDEILRPLSQVDHFTGNFLQINNTVRQEGRAQPIICCINRADYMLDKYSGGASGQNELRVRQVEVNAIASSMSAHSHNTRSLQDFLMSKYDLAIPDRPSATFPKDESLDLVSRGLIEANDAYGRSSAQILVVTERMSRNFSDQVLIEVAANKLRPDIKFVRRSFNELPGAVRLGPNKELLLDDATEISVVYFRFCYDPSQYGFDGAWETRLLLERSRAIKCPSINFHLSGAKKFQQVLDSQDQLERYLETDEAKRIEKVFCKFWSVESEQSEGYKMVMKRDTNKLVLKPQREGGGHNIFGQDIKPFLETLNEPKDRSQYILMEFIDGPLEKNWLLVHDDKHEDGTRLSDNCDQLISELGIFGSILADGSSTIMSNKSAGYLVRSKKFGVNEGGVAKGYAGISNLILLDDVQGGHSDCSAYFENF